MKQMTERLEQHALKQEKAFVVTANPEIVMKAVEDKKYKQTIDQASYVVADGIGVVKAAQLLGEPLPERVAGYDLMHQCLKVANDHGLNIYLLGAKDEVLTQAITNINKSYPSAKVVGSHHGFFEWENETIQQEIKQLAPDFVFVALGVPRQEYWIAERLNQFEKGVFIGVGGSFDVIAGNVQRAPEIWQKLNLEWFYRLLKQPSRWRRMLVLPQFAVKVLREKQKRSST
jgi:N-acetylglucosaminyldiphosphoundecaprenol N-acetyl-beta-D-mannosaminyltransferase